MKYIFSKTFSGESGGTINYVIAKKKDLDFLIMGASRAKHGIDPKAITSIGPKGHNLGINATNVVNQLILLDILIRNGVHPRTVILQTDFFTYDKSADTHELLLDQIKRLYPYNTPLLGSYVIKAGMKEKILYFFDTYKLNRKIANIGFNFLKNTNKDLGNGFVGLPGIDSPLSDKQLFEDYKYYATSTNSIALKRMLKITNDNSINLILVFGPSYKNVLYNQKQMISLKQDLREKGFKNIIDLTDIRKFPELEDEINWRDSVHFTTTGAEIFSEILNKEIRKLELP